MNEWVSNGRTSTIPVPLRVSVHPSFGTAMEERHSNINSLSLPSLFSFCLPAYCCMLHSSPLLSAPQILKEQLQYPKTHSEPLPHRGGGGAAVGCVDKPTSSAALPGVFMQQEHVDWHVLSVERETMPCCGFEFGPIFLHL